MKFMNDYDLDFAIRRFEVSPTPRRLEVALLVDRLRQWTDSVSDGWAYWPKPCRAAAKAIALIESTTNAANDLQQRHDATEAEVIAAIAPIKAFLTRHNVRATDRAFILGG